MRLDWTRFILLSKDITDPMWLPSVYHQQQTDTPPFTYWSCCSAQCRAADQRHSGGCGMILGENEASIKKKVLKQWYVWREPSEASLKISLSRCQSMSRWIMETMNERGRVWGQSPIMKGSFCNTQCWSSSDVSTARVLIWFIYHMRG